MDSFEGAATLEWWANRSTCLAGFGVRVAVRVSGNDWTCEAVPDPPLAGEDQDSFGFLMALDPVFTLRFDDESLLHVNVAVAGRDGRLTLTAYRAEPGEPAGTRALPYTPVPTRSAGRSPGNL
ncbi:hypothetical protein [Actinacidiphila bryophytorum]|uniref:hypothetical protein n=1 Tax=Actinacidiphila bryophytorum TaxID=1436133 RepID=UPI002176CA07|nr:hypothetical protein [Actinacidiphila bryophytorum]UWE10172.1 hypothetical protein NYE86_16600 [Actinacidiphila bryophytorum]